MDHWPCREVTGHHHHKVHGGDLTVPMAMPVRLTGIFIMASSSPCIMRWRRIITPSFPIRNRDGIPTLRPVSSFTMSTIYSSFCSSLSAITTAIAPATSAKFDFVKNEQPPRSTKATLFWTSFARGRQASIGSAITSPILVYCLSKFVPKSFACRNLYV